ncbi:tetratricopeptide repeat protein [Pseudooceanicola sediminis]|nr:tetratricopeptide repeat protein [Pseudooceanicola sediminis]|tara:strand:- start:68 stop:628 length:561 start_codon:yes stop_codon:yes gene_type:complete
MAERDPLTGALAHGDWPLAERLLMRAAHKGKPPAAVLYNLGRVMMEQGKWGPARTWLRRALARDKGHAKAWFELGRVELELGDLDAAGAAFGRVLGLTPGDSDARINLGRIVLRLGRYEELRAVLQPLAGRDVEVDGMLYRAAAELRLPEAEALRRDLWRRDGRGERAAALRALTRASKGCLPLDL